MAKKAFEAAAVANATLTKQCTYRKGNAMISNCRPHEEMTMEKEMTVEKKELQSQVRKPFTEPRLRIYGDVKPIAKSRHNEPSTESGMPSPTGIKTAG